MSIFSETAGRDPLKRLCNLMTKAGDLYVNEIERE